MAALCNSDSILESECRFSSSSWQENTATENTPTIYFIFIVFEDENVAKHCKQKALHDFYQEHTFIF